MFKIRERLIYFSFLLFVFLIPLSQLLSIRVLVAISIVSIFSDKNQRPIRFLENSWDVVVYLAVLILGLTYSSDLVAGVRVLETLSSLLLVPFVISRFSFNKKRLENTMITFVVGLLLASILSLTYATINFYKSNEIESFFYYRLLEMVNLQPTYFAYYLCFSLTLGLYFLYNDNLQSFSFLLVAVLVILFVVLILTEARTAYVSMLFMFSFFILKFLFAEERSGSKRMTFALVIVFMMSMLVINQFNFKGTEPINGDYWERIALWKSAIHANVNYLFGVGTGDYKTVLNQYYTNQGMNQYAEESYNSHNQFIQSFFSNGILGLIALMGIIARPLYLSFRIQNSLGILIIFPFIIYGITEVFLGRYQGVVFFSLCHEVVISQYYDARANLVMKMS